MKKKILVIDDHEHIRYLLCNRLQKSGFLTLAAGTAQAGIDLALLENPDLILMDIMLPEIDGIDALKLLKDHSKTENIPVIMLSALSSAQTISECQECGSHDFIIKPFHPDTLHKKIVEVIGEP